MKKAFKSQGDMKQLRASSVRSEVLRLGSKGAAVADLQTQLQNAGVYKGEITGLYSSKTADSVKDFQHRQKLPANGVVEPKTWAFLGGLYQPILVAAPANAMSIRTYIELIEAYERQFPDEARNTSSMITQLRKIYYGEKSWDEYLIKGAAHISRPYVIEREEVGREKVKADPFGWMSFDLVRYRVTPYDAKGKIPALFTGQELRLEDGSFLDMGHVFAGLDALQYPHMVDGPASINITKNVDAVTWVGDLGSVQAGVQIKFVNNGLEPIANKVVQAIINEYASPQDMLGNIDAYVLWKHVKPGRKVSEILRDYYLKNNTERDHRYSLFAKSIGLNWNGSAFSNEEQWLKDYTDEVNDSAALYLAASTSSGFKLNYLAALGMSMNQFAEILLTLFLEALKTRIGDEGK